MKQIADLLSSIKSKTTYIKSQTEMLNKFNVKIELLLKSIQAYSSEPYNENYKEEMADFNRNEKAKSQKALNIKQDAPTSQKTDPKTKIANLFLSNKNSKNIALQLFNIISDSKIIPLEEIVKRMKLSKYKIIEILNFLVKEKIILKYFDKGFMYKLNTCWFSFILEKDFSKSFLFYTINYLIWNSEYIFVILVPTNNY